MSDSAASSSSSASAGCPYPASAACSAAPSCSFIGKNATQWDRCVENGLVKSAYGLAAGAATAIIAFRARSFRSAVTGFGAGVGAGVAYYECQQAYSPKSYTTPLTDAPSSSTSTSSSPSSKNGNQWDRCIENGLIKSTYGLAGGLALSLILFRSGSLRLAATGFGAGMGAGVSYYQCKQTYSPKTYTNSLLTPSQNAVLQNPTICRCGRATCRCGPNCKMVPLGFSAVQNGVLPLVRETPAK